MEKNYYKAYANATQTLAKTRQIVLLYDGLIRFVQQAKTAIENKRIEERFNLLIKASEVISGLQACLDFEKGGEVAKILYSFYASIDSRIYSIHRTNSLETCDEVIAELRQMREAWAEIDQNSSAQEAAAAAPAAPTPAAAGQSPAEQHITFSA